VDRLRSLLATDDEGQQALRVLGGMLLGAGMLVLAIRRSSDFANPWGDGLLFLVLLAPCVFLYGLGMLTARGSDVRRSWQAAYLVFGVLLVPLVLFQLVEWVGASPDAPLNVAWVFLLSAVAGVAAALLGGVRVGLLLASLALVVAWVALWDELLSDGAFEDRTVLRWLLLAIAAILVAACVALRRLRPGSDPSRWNELITAAGVAALTGAAAFDLASYYLQSIFACSRSSPTSAAHSR
jgi:hypothetical protein